MKAENLSFTREKLEGTVSFTEYFKFIVAALTQQNLGERDGIAADTDKVFITAMVAWIM